MVLMVVVVVLMIIMLIDGRRLWWRPTSSPTSTQRAPNAPNLAGQPKIINSRGQIKFRIKSGPSISSLGRPNWPPNAGESATSGHCRPSAALNQFVAAVGAVEAVVVAASEAEHDEGEEKERPSADAAPGECRVVAAESPSRPTSRQPSRPVASLLAAAN